LKTTVLPQMRAGKIFHGRNGHRKIPWGDQTEKRRWGRELTSYPYSGVQREQFLQRASFPRPPYNTPYRWLPEHPRGFRKDLLLGSLGSFRYRTPVCSAVTGKMQ
jgi:hypothetical protein